MQTTLIVNRFDRWVNSPLKIYVTLSKGGEERIGGEGRGGEKRGGERRGGERRGREERRGEERRGSRGEVLWVGIEWREEER